MSYQDFLFTLEPNSDIENVWISTLTKEKLYKDTELDYEIVEVRTVENPTLRNKFEDKRSQFVKKNYERKEYKSFYGFSVEPEHKLYSLIVNGPVNSPGNIHLLGNNRHGFRIWRHPDVCMKLAHFQKKQNCFLVMYKFMYGKAKHVIVDKYRREPYSPTEGYDCHLSAINACPNISVSNNINNSQVYLYSLDPETQKSLQPTQVYPIAVMNLLEKSVIEQLEENLTNVPEKDETRNLALKETKSVFNTDESFKFDLKENFCNKKNLTCPLSIVVEKHMPSKFQQLLGCLYNKPLNERFNTNECLKKEAVNDLQSCKIEKEIEKLRPRVRFSDSGNRAFTDMSHGFHWVSVTFTEPINPAGCNIKPQYATEKTNIRLKREKNIQTEPCDVRGKNEKLISDVNPHVCPKLFSPETDIVSQLKCPFSDKNGDCNRSVETPRLETKPKDIASLVQDLIFIEANSPKEKACIIKDEIAPHCDYNNDEEKDKNFETDLESAPMSTSSIESSSDTERYLKFENEKEKLKTETNLQKGSISYSAARKTKGDKVSNSKSAFISTFLEVNPRVMPKSTYIQHIQHLDWMKNKKVPQRVSGQRSTLGDYETENNKGVQAISKKLDTASKSTSANEINKLTEVKTHPSKKHGISSSHLEGCIDGRLISEYSFKTRTQQHCPSKKSPEFKSMITADKNYYCGYSLSISPRKLPFEKTYVERFYSNENAGNLYASKDNNFTKTKRNYSEYSDLQNQNFAGCSGRSKCRSPQYLNQSRFDRDYSSQRECSSLRRSLSRSPVAYKRSLSRSPCYRKENPLNLTRSSPDRTSSFSPNFRKRSVTPPRYQCSYQSYSKWSEYSQTYSISPDSHCERVPPSTMPKRKKKKAKKNSKEKKIKEYNMKYYTPMALKQVKKMKQDNLKIITSQDIPVRKRKKKRAHKKKNIKEGSYSESDNREIVVILSDKDDNVVEMESSSDANYNPAQNKQSVFERIGWANSPNQSSYLPTNENTATADTNRNLNTTSIHEPRNAKEHKKSSGSRKSAFTRLGYSEFIYDGDKTEECPREPFQRRIMPEKRDTVDYSDLNFV